MIGTPGVRSYDEAVAEDPGAGDASGAWHLPGIEPRAEAWYLEVVEAGLRGRPVTPATAPYADSLLAAGLAYRTEVDGEPSIIATNMRSVFRGVIRRRERDLDEMRRAANTLVDAYDRRHQSDHFVEVLHDLPVIRDHFSRAQLKARSVIRAFERGPFLQDPPIISAEQAEAASRGVEYRVVYESGVVNSETGSKATQLAIEMGERAHVFAKLPMKLLIFDDDHALIVLNRRGEGSDSVMANAIVVYPSPLLAALTEMFESVWEMSVPITPAPAPGDAGDEGLRLLSMLAAGSPDASIARHLGVSERTVQRRIARLQQQHGVQSRFQLGFQIARQRLLDDGGPPAIT